MPAKTAPRIFQIYYDDRTRLGNDPGFLQLDNLSNARPDWSEYWPIRNYLRDTALDDGVHYGFLSPKFRQKTGLDAAAMLQFLESSDGDVVLFSPFFDQSAFALNIFEQAAAQHPDIWPSFDAAFRAAGIEVDIRRLVMSSEDTVFCNYFAASKPFWTAWFELTEKIFAACEDPRHPDAAALNATVSHSGIAYPAKVFVIERVASLMLATDRRWRVQSYNPMLLPYSQSRIARFKAELCDLDALKIAFRHTGRFDYMKSFMEKRARLTQP